MTLTFFNVVSIIILFQLVLLVLFLITINKGKRRSNQILAAFFGLLIINLTDGLLTYYGFYTKFPAFAQLEDSFVFLFGPALYFYTCSIIYSDFTFSKKDWLHVIPFFVTTVGYQLYYHLQSTQEQLKIQGAIVNHELPIGFYLSALLVYGHIGLYLYFSLSKLQYYRMRIREKFSSLEKINLEWLSYMLWFIVAIILLSLTNTLMPAIGLREYFLAAFGLVLILMCVFINGVVWKGLRQPEIFAGVDAEKRYKDQLTDQEQRQIQQALTDAMEIRKEFLKSELTLDTLAESIGFQTRKVSQVINDLFKQNFFDYINTYRIKEAERLLRNPVDPKTTVLEVMYAAGFNSKSSFNTIFKQKTGLTPSEYKRRHG